MQDFLLEVNMEMIKVAKAAFFSTEKEAINMKMFFMGMLLGSLVMFVMMVTFSTKQYNKGYNDRKNGN